MFSTAVPRSRSARHRESIDFDFVSRGAFDPTALTLEITFMRDAQITQQAPNTLTGIVDRAGVVKVSFFGLPLLERLQPPHEVPENGLRVASPLADPVRFMAYAMTHAVHADMRVLGRHVSDEDFREAPDRAPPGIIDPRSWAYWNLKFGCYSPPPLPTRKLAEFGFLRTRLYRLIAFATACQT